jgi:phytoene dehydrogenase-like protein
MGKASGVDLLNGENVAATHAIVSNMTVWDTYGKLIGLQRTPAEIKKRLGALRSHGVYMIFAAAEDSAVASLPADRLLVSTNEQADPDSLIDTSGFVFASAPAWDPRGVDNKRAATITFRADVEQWFTYQVDISEQEEKDQEALEIAWQLLHKYLPELGGDIEAIETATPQTYYDATRRKLGMVGIPTQYSDTSLGYRTSLPNVFIVGDTVSSFPSLAAVSQTALTIVNELHPTKN